MASKVIFFVCAQALFVQIVLSQCLGRETFAAPASVAPACGYSGAWNAGALGEARVTGLGIGESFRDGTGFVGNDWAGSGIGIIPTSGGALPVSSGSAIAPTGISIDSENAYEGALEVTGQLPFVSTVGLEAVLPTAGTGIVNHSCGNAIAIAPTAAYGPSVASIAPAAGRVGYGGVGNVGLINGGHNYGSLGYGGVSNAGLGCGCGVY